MQSEIKKTLKDLHRSYRAVTAEDYEKLVLEDWNDSPENNVKIARVLCLPNYKLTTEEKENILKEFEEQIVFAKGHITLVVVPKKDNGKDNGKNKYDKLSKFLEPRNLLTTQLHITKPDYIKVKIEAVIIIEEGANKVEVEKLTKDTVNKFFNPLNSGNNVKGKGWPFGRSVYLSELYKLFNVLEGVDYVEKLKINDQDDIPNNEIFLARNQLVKFREDESKFTIKDKSEKNEQNQSS